VHFSVSIDRPSETVKTFFFFVVFKTIDLEDVKKEMALLFRIFFRGGQLESRMGVVNRCAGWSPDWGQ